MYVQNLFLNVISLQSQIYHLVYHAPYCSPFLSLFGWKVCYLIWSYFFFFLLIYLCIDNNIFKIGYPGKWTTRWTKTHYKCQWNYQEFHSSLLFLAPPFRKCMLKHTNLSIDPLWCHIGHWHHTLHQVFQAFLAETLLPNTWKRSVSFGGLKPFLEGGCKQRTTYAYFLQM